MRYLPATPLRLAFRYSLLKDDIIDFPYFFINLNFFFRFCRFLRSALVRFVLKLVKYFNAICYWHRNGLTNSEKLLPPQLATTIMTICYSLIYMLTKIFMINSITCMKISCVCYHMHKTCSTLWCRKIGDALERRKIEFKLCRWKGTKIKRFYRR